MIKRGLQSPITFHKREDDGHYVTLSGYAVEWDTRSEVYPGFGEVFKREAFPKSTLTDTRYLIKHTGLPLARVKSGTLSIREDEKGLLVEPTLDTRDPDSAGLVIKVERGDVDGQSVGFMMKDGKQKMLYNDDGTVTREIQQVGKLMEVSAVTFPVHNSDLQVSQRMKTELPEDVLAYLERDLDAEKIQKDLRECEDFKLRIRLTN